jgi:hypothetical protein
MIRAVSTFALGVLVLNQSYAPEASASRGQRKFVGTQADAPSLDAVPPIPALADSTSIAESTAGCGISITPTWTINVVGGGLDVLRIPGRIDWFDVVAPVGDVNADGFTDLVIRSVGQGRSFVHYGSAEGPSGTPSWATTGLGWPVGDINGDGYDDLLVSRPGAATGVKSIHLILGSSAGLSIELQSFSDLAGVWKWAGDLNADGYGDFLLSASELHVYFGSSGGAIGPTVLANGSDAAGVGDLDADGFDDIAVVAFGPEFRWVRGSAAGLGPIVTIPDLVVYANRVAPVGDLNGDGFAEVAFSESDGICEVGSLVEVRCGPPVGSVTDCHGMAGEGENGFGSSVSGSDVNGDGLADLIVGAVGSPEVGEGGDCRPGSAVLYPGDRTGAMRTRNWRVEGGSDGRQGNASASGAGDVNGDGFGDVAVAWNDERRVELYSGRCLELSAVGESGLGRGALLPAGDLNSDGYDDVENETGEILYGGPSGIISSLQVRSEQAIESSTEAPATNGPSILGDVNADGFDDVVEVSMTEDHIGLRLGSSAGETESETLGIDASDSGGVRLEWAAVHDVNGDGHADLLFRSVARRFANAFLFFGSQSGLRLSEFWHVSLPSSDKDYLESRYLSALGDVNGDGFSDFLLTDFFNFSESRSILTTTLYVGAPSGPQPGAVWQAPLISSFASPSPLGDVNGDGFSDFYLRLSDVHYGNGRGRPRAPRQLQPFSTTTIPIGGSSNSATGFDIAALASSPQGRTPLRLEWEVARVGASYDRHRRHQGQLYDSGPAEVGLGSAIEIRETVSVDDDGRYKWRARIASRSPLFPHGPWFSASGNSVTEAKVTIGAVDAPPTCPIGPGPSDLVYPDSPIPSFTWQQGTGRRFRIEWSSNPDFIAAVERTPDLTLATSEFGIGVVRPDATQWSRILRLGVAPDLRVGHVFWRVVALDAAETACSERPTSLRLAAALAPELLLPEDGAPFSAGESPPSLSWTPNHNESFRARFSTNPHLGEPRVDSDSTYAIDTISRDSSGAPVVIWTVPVDKWSALGALAANHAGNRLYYAVFGEDALSRVTWSRVRTMVIVPATESPTTAPRRSPTMKRPSGSQPSRLDHRR